MFKPSKVVNGIGVVAGYFIWLMRLLWVGSVAGGHEEPGKSLRGGFSLDETSELYHLIYKLLNCEERDCWN